MRPSLHEDWEDGPPEARSWRFTRRWAHTITLPRHHAGLWCSIQIIAKCGNCRDQLFFAPCAIQCRSNSSSAGAKGVTLDVSGGILKWG